MPSWKVRGRVIFPKQLESIKGDDNVLKFRYALPVCFCLQIDKFVANNAQRVLRQADVDSPEPMDV